MPAAIDYRPNDKTLRAAAEDELRTRREASAKAWRYYEGRAPKTLKVRRDGDDDNVNVNLLRTAVDRVVAFLVPQMPQLEITLGADTEDEVWLRACWAVNGGARALARMARFGCLEGHVFVKVLPGPMPRFAVLNPTNVLVWWAADDVDRVLWYEQRWETGDMRFRQDIVRDGDTWAVLEYMAPLTGEWRETGATVWPYPDPPIADWQHDTNPRGYYGGAETGNLALNDRVNRTASDMARILRYHASPRTVGTGFSVGDEQETSIGGLWTISNPEAKVYNLEMKGDLAASMNALEYLTRAYLAERRVVMLKGDVSDFQRVTNLALRALYMDQIAKNEELRRAYEWGIQIVSRRALMIAGRPYETPPRVIWPDPLPSDPREMVDVLEKERGLGIVSRETAAHERGRDWEIEQARIEEEGESMIDRLLREPPEMGIGDTART